jgi:hypothetical protein
VLHSTAIPIGIKQIKNVGQGVGKTLLGLPMSFKDNEFYQLIFNPATFNVENGLLTSKISKDKNSSF